MFRAPESVNRVTRRWLQAMMLAAALFGVAAPAQAGPPGTQIALFGFGKSKDQADAPPPPPPANKEPLFCPTIVVQPGTAAFTLYERGKEGDPMGVRYQASFTETARECVDMGVEVGVRIGISGRALAGPLGVPGQNIDVPIRFVVLDDKKQVIISRLTKLQVTIPAGQTGVTFTHVEELGSLPFPGKSFRKWDFRIGFETKTPGKAQG